MSMLEAKTSRNCVYQTAYHIIWIPKYRQRVLTGGVNAELRVILHDVAVNKGMEVLSLDIQPDYIHLFVSIPPAMAVAQAVKYFKGISARKLLVQFPELKPLIETVKGEAKAGNGSLWSPNYYVGTEGDVSAETIRRYIEKAESITIRR